MIQKGLLLTMLLLIGPGDIGKINTAKQEARKAYLAGDYKTAIDKYTYLVDSAGVTEDEVRMNLANSYFHVNDTAKAIQAYQPLTLSTNPRLKSVANQQLGVLLNREGKMEQALTYFKMAMKANPANEDARFNYELVKKKLDEKKKKEEQNKDKKEQQNKEQQNKEENKDQQDKKDQEQKEQQDKEQQEKEQKDKEQKSKEQKEKEQKEKEQKDKEEQEQKEKQERKDIPPSVKEKLKDMDMSEEKARMILEAMKNQEIQYLQQNKRKSNKPKDKTKPDW